MNRFSDLMSSVQRVFCQVTETGFVFLGFVVLVYLLLGEQSGSFVISVIANMSVLVNVITPQVLGALGLGLALLYLAKNRGDCLKSRLTPLAEGPNSASTNVPP